MRETMSAGAMHPERTCTTRAQTRTYVVPTGHRADHVQGFVSRGTPAFARWPGMGTGQTTFCRHGHLSKAPFGKITSVGPGCAMELLGSGPGWPRRAKGRRNNGRVLKGRGLRELPEFTGLR